jgi:hypothetical protein
LQRHVGIPVDDEGRQDVLSDDDDDDDDDEHSYYSEEDEMLGMSDMQQPSYVPFRQNRSFVRWLSLLTHVTTMPSFPE